MFSKKNIFWLIFTSWAVIWVGFIARDLFGHDYISDYTVLLERDADGKRSYAYGDYFYEFLKFAGERLPQEAFFEFRGVETGTVSWRRGIYFLYPRLNGKGAEYILVYDVPGYAEEGYGPYAGLDGSRYILRRRQAP